MNIYAAINFMRYPDWSVIYILDRDPNKCAEYYCNKHVTIKILEITDILYGTYMISNLTLSDDIRRSDPDFIRDYLKDYPFHKAALTEELFQKHPSFLWARESIQNYRWLAELGYALCQEYTYRWGKKHQYEDYIIWLKNNEPLLTDTGLTQFPLSMPERFKSEDPVESYRQFYMVYKQKPHWGKRGKPDWFIESDLDQLIRSSAIDDSVEEFFPILLMSEEKIIGHSFGLIENPEKINWKTQLPVDGGLFCGKIFGPLRDYTCFCGKYNDSKKKHNICEECGVEFIKARARRERFAHIVLVTPVLHSWFKEIISILLDLSISDLDSIVHHKRYIVTRSDIPSLREGKILTEKEVRENWHRFGKKFSFSSGAIAIRELLVKIDLNERHHELERTFENSSQHDDFINLKLIDIFKKSGNKADWMVPDIIPVLPPDSRTSFSRYKRGFVTSEINYEYQRVIRANNRLIRFFELSDSYWLPIIKIQESSLQNAVDNLFCGRKNRVSLSSLLVLNFMHLQKKYYSPDSEIKAFDPSVYFAEFDVKEYPDNLRNYDDCFRELSLEDVINKVFRLLHALCIDVDCLMCLNSVEELIKSIQQIISLFIPHIKRKYDYEYV